MNIVVFGANRGTGLQIVLQALARAHNVTAVVRRPERFKVGFDRLRVVAGDALVPGSFSDAMAKQDIVISAIGFAGMPQRPISFHVDTARNITAEMTRHNVGRYIGITSVGVYKDPTSPLWYRAIVHPLLRHKYNDMARMEDHVTSSALEWSLVRPARLVDTELTQDYRLGENGTIKNVSKVSRADVADLIVRRMARGAFTRRAIAISY